ncbi:U1 small nuclear ribonucleoprotein C, partial [Coemansia sp. RSA 560]
MPKYYCDYCDIFLTHDSSSVRKAHNTGWKHINQVAAYYQALEPSKTQEIIDAITAAHDGQLPIDVETRTETGVVNLMETGVEGIRMAIVEAETLMETGVAGILMEIDVETRMARPGGTNGGIIAAEEHH